MLYLIGVNHRIQYPLGCKYDNCSDEEKEIFCNYVKKKISTLDKISFIAEEFNDDVKKEAKLIGYDIKFTLLENLVKGLNSSKKFNLQHIFIEATQAENQEFNLGIFTPREIRKNFGIKVVNPSQLEEDTYKREHEKYFLPRENFWISKIQSRIDNNESGLVIIGLDHTETFFMRLKSKNIPCRVLYPKWLPDSYASI